MTSHRVIAGVLILLLHHSSSFAQRGVSIVEAEVTTATGSRGVIVRPSGDGPFPAVLHMHGSGDTVANNVDVLRLFARAGYVAMDVEYRELSLLESKLKSMGRSVEFFSYAGAGHNTMPWDQVYAKVLSFFASHVQ